MSLANYRFSVIPAGAVTDRSLEARDLQVLCLLGRHTNKAGWCFRSQVKMAEEIGCGRGSVQRSLDRLYKAGWVEKRQRNLGATEPDPKHPHTAHAYRVRLDRDDLPDELFTPEEPEYPTEAEAGCPPVGTPNHGPDGHPGAQPYTGTGCPAMGGHPIKEPLERNPSEPERESAREATKRIPVTTFLKRWPSAAVDSREAIEREWELLPEHELQPALDGIEPFLEELKRLKRTHVPAGATYLKERKWQGLPERSEAPKASTFVELDAWSREWWAMLLARADRGEPIASAVDQAKERGTRKASERADRMPPAEVIASLKPAPADGDWLAAWRPWFERRGAKLPDWRHRIWVFLPSAEPPVQGAPALRITGPPTQPGELMSEADRKAMAEDWNK